MSVPTKEIFSEAARRDRTKLVEGAPPAPVMRIRFIK